MLEIRERSETSTAVTTKRIYSSGAWTLASDTATARGCFSTKELRSIRRALQQAAWKITTSPIACFAYDPNYTEYVLNGRLRYTHRMCSGKTADADTLAAIDFVQRELAEEMPPPPPVKPPPPVTPTPMPPVTPPLVATCEAAGTPMVEIRERAEIAMETSTTKIYASGAWTFQPVDKDGHLGTFERGCFDRKELRDIREAVKRAPWKVTESRIRCFAYDPSFTDWVVDGRLLFTERMCSGKTADAETMDAISLVKQMVAAERTPTRPEPRPMRPEPRPMAPGAR
jgi:hypothetical protein